MSSANSNQPYSRIPLPQLPPLPFANPIDHDGPSQAHGSQLSRSLTENSSQSSHSARTLVASNTGETITDSNKIISENSKIFSGNISFPSADHETSDDSLTATTSSTLPRNWFKRWFVDWWLTEIISWGFGVVCMIIIATVLSKYDGKQDPKWKTGITIGSFISIFSGLAKSALLLPTAEALGQLKWDWFKKSSENRIKDLERLDSASRGPWGSLILLVRARKVTLPTLGAAIILLSLPLDGLFQRIVSYPITTVLDSNAIATISRTVLYDPRPEIIWKNGTALMPQDLQLDSLIYPFWQGKGIIPGVEFDCSTSKCTYDPFYTLALDFECTPIPDFLEFGCRNTSGEWLTTTSYSNFNGTDQIPKVTSCGYYMNVPNHQAQLMSGYEVEADGSIGEVLSTRIFPLMDIVTNEPYLRSPNFDVKTPVVDFILASTPGGFAGARQNSTPVVTECEIHWVVKKLKAEVSLGVLVEEVLETLQFETVNSDNPYSPWDGLNSPIWLGNFSMDLADPHSPTSLSTFGLDNTTAKKVWAVWAEIAPSTFNLPADNNPVKTGPVQKVLWGSQIPDLQAVSDPILPWDTPNNVTQHMADAVKVMNQVIRRNALSQRGSEGRARDVAIGHAWIDVRFVKVNWAWITMPLALLLISGAFLLATVIRTSDGSISIGKTSGLGYLFNDTGERRMSKWLAPEQSPKFGQ